MTDKCDLFTGFTASRTSTSNSRPRTSGFIKLKTSNLLCACCTDNMIQWVDISKVTLRLLFILEHSFCVVLIRARPYMLMSYY